MPDLVHPLYTAGRRVTLWVILVACAGALKLTDTWRSLNGIRDCTEGMLRGLMRVRGEKKYAQLL